MFCDIAFFQGQSVTPSNYNNHYDSDDEAEKIDFIKFLLMCGNFLLENA